jgi:hypothetical protein
MSETAVPEVLQAEAYIGDAYILIANSKTADEVEFTKQVVDRPVRGVPDFAAFLDETAPLIAGRRVLIALGDSRTANFNNWPHAVARRRSDIAVINLADWACSAEVHLPALEFYLRWLVDKGTIAADVVLFGTLRELGDRMFFHSSFMNNVHPHPFSEDEESLISHRYGAELASLADDIPTEGEDAIKLWVARRILALTRLFDGVCAEVGCRFIAVIEPVSYGDYTPSYPRALKSSYLAAKTGDAPFEEWCREQDYVLDPSGYFEPGIRQAFEYLRKLWQREAGRSRRAKYVDWSGLFHNEETGCFDIHFDAMHYNEHGAELIADAVVDLLRHE